MDPAAAKLFERRSRVERLAELPLLDPVADVTITPINGQNGVEEEEETFYQALNTLRDAHQSCVTRYGQQAEEQHKQLQHEQALVASQRQESERLRVERDLLHVELQRQQEETTAAAIQLQTAADTMQQRIDTLSLQNGQLQEELLLSRCERDDMQRKLTRADAIEQLDGPQIGLSDDDRRAQKERLHIILDQLSSENRREIQQIVDAFEDATLLTRKSLIAQQEECRRANERYDDIIRRFRHKTEEWERWRAWFNAKRREKTSTISDSPRQSPRIDTSLTAFNGGPNTTASERDSQAFISDAPSSPTRKRLRTSEAATATPSAQRHATTAVADSEALEPVLVYVDGVPRPLGPLDRYKTSPKRSPRRKHNTYTTPRKNGARSIRQVAPLTASPTLGRQSDEPRIRDSIEDITSEEEPVRSGSRRRRRSASPSFRFEEVVRSKDGRRQMQAETCIACEKFYQATGPIQPLPELGAPSPHTRSTGADGRCQHSPAMQRRLQQVSRHRTRHARPSSPQNYWDTDFPDTQEIEALRRQQQLQ